MSSPLSRRTPHRWAEHPWTGFGSFVVNSGSDFCVEAFHQIHNHVNDGLISDGGVDHGVINGAVRPFDMEILLNEIGALAIDGIHALLSFFLSFAASHEAPHFVFSWSVKKHSQRVLAVPEKMLRASSDDDRVSGLRHVLHHTPGNLRNTFAVNQVELVGIEAAFITAAQKGFEKPVVEWVGFLLPVRHDGLGTIGQPRDLLGELLIPKLPAQLRGKLLRDFAAATSVSRSMVTIRIM